MPDHFIEMWKKFRRVRLQLSIDDLRERNYYVRFPSDWDTIMKSYYKILKYRDVFKLEVCQTVSALNVFNIDNFKKWTLDDDMVVSHNYVHYPDHLHVSLIPEEMKYRILDNIQYMREDEVQRLKIELFREHTEKDIKRFHSFIRLNDRGRKVKIYDYLPEFQGVIYDYKCKYPWVHLSNTPSGTVKPCCHYSENITDDNGKPFYIQKDNISKIFTSNYMKNLRNSFRKGEKPEQCTSCWNNEDLGLESKRQAYNRTFTSRPSPIWTTSMKTDFADEPLYPQEYQLTLNNSCNLKCRMCHPGASSSWVKESSQYTKEEKSIVERGFDVKFKHKQPSSPGSLFMENIEEWAPYVRSLEALGGEPLYSNAWYKLIDFLIEHDYAKNISLSIVTNGTFYNDNFIKKVIKNFRSFIISLSIDGMDRVFEYLRSNAEWESVKQNILSFQQLALDKAYKNFSINYTYTVSWFNVLQMEEFIEFSNTKNTGGTIWFNKVDYPKWMSLPAAPASIKPKLIKALQKLIDEKHGRGVYRFEAEGLLNFLNTEIPTEDSYKKYGKEILVLDKHRDIKTVDIVEHIDKESL